MTPDDITKARESLATLAEECNSRYPDTDITDKAINIVQGTLNFLTSQVQKLTAERDALREALKPFAKEASQWSAMVDRDELWLVCARPIEYASGTSACTYGDLRRAAALIKDREDG